MAKPLVVSLSHELGKAEAKRRLVDGIAYMRSNYAKIVTVRQESWDGDRLNFEIGTLGQSLSGFIDVAEDQCTLSVKLPLLLAMMAEKARSLIQKEGQLLLEKK